MRYTGELARAYGVLAHERNIVAGNPERWESEARDLSWYVPRRGRVLDIGCGAGRDAVLLPSVGFRYTGVDISCEMLAEARKLAPDASFTRGDVYTLPFAGGMFDGFWAAASLLHIPRYYIGRVLSEVHRVLRPSGVGFIAMKEGVGERMVPGPLPGTDRFFSFWQQGEFVATLRAQGFYVLDSCRRKLSPEDSTTWLTFFAQRIQ